MSKYNQDFVKLSVNVDYELKQQMTEYGKTNDMTLSQIVRAAVIKYLEKNTKEWEDGRIQSV